MGAWLRDASSRALAPSARDTPPAQVSPMLTISRHCKAGEVDPKTGEGLLDYYKKKELAKLAELSYYTHSLRSATAGATTATSGALGPSPTPGSASAPNDVAATAAALDQANVVFVQRDGVNRAEINGAPALLESMPRWFGKAAADLGLKDPTGAQSLLQMFAHMEEAARGIAPNTNGQQKVMGAGDEHQMGLDLTWSAPKAVSLVAEFGTPELIKTVEEIQEESVRLGLKFMEDCVAMTRFGAGGTIKKQVEGLIGVTFGHRASRDLDPQLHHHSIVFNMARAIHPDTGKEVWRTIDSKTMFGMKMAAGALYRSNMAKRFAELGFIIERTGPKKDLFTFEGFSKASLKQASKRTAAIEALFEKKGLQDASAAHKAKIKLETRKSKDEPPYHELRQMWLEEENNYNWGPEQTQMLLDQSIAAREAGNVQEFVLDRRAVLETVTMTQARFMESDLIHAIAIESVGHWGIERVLEEARAIQDELAHELIALEMDDYGRRYYTTPKMDRMERAIQDDIGRGLTDRRHHVPPEAAIRLLREFEAYKSAKSPRGKPFKLKDEQFNAALKALSGTGTVAILKGAAGVGKTTVAEAIAWAFEHYERAAFNVQGTAIASRAATGLGNDAKIESNNIAKLLTKLDNGAHKSKNGQPPQLNIGEGSILFVDESAMVDTRSMHRLMMYQRQLRFKMVWFGDVRQLAPVLAGNPHLTAEIHYEHLIAASMTQITRQKEETMRQLVLRAMNSHHAAYKINDRGEAVNSKGQPTLNVAEKIPVYRSIMMTPAQRAELSKLETAAIERYLAEHDAALARVATTNAASQAAAVRNPNQAAPAANSSAASAALAAQFHARALRPVAAPAARTDLNVPVDPESQRRINEAIRAKLRAQGHLSATDHPLVVEQALENVSGSELVRHFAEGERIRFTQPVESLQIGAHALGVIQSLRVERGANGAETLHATVRLDQRGDAQARVLEINLSAHHDIDYAYCVRTSEATELRAAHARNAQVIVEGLDELGRLHIMSPRQPDEIYRRVVNDWINAKQDWPDATKDAKGEFFDIPLASKAMYAGQNTDVRALNHVAREALKARGLIRSKPGEQFTFTRPADGSPEEDRQREISVGDRIVFTGVLKAKETGSIALDNGTFATVERLRKNTSGETILTARLESEDPTVAAKTVTLNLTRLELAYDEQADRVGRCLIDLGYATTIHKAQGATVDKAFVLYSETMGDSQWFYVAISRARYGSEVYSAAQSIGEMRDDHGLAEEVYKALSAEDRWKVDQYFQRLALAEAVGRDGAKHSALDFPALDPAHRPEGTVPLRDPYEPIIPEGWPRPTPAPAPEKPPKPQARQRAGRNGAGAEPTQPDAPAVLVAHGAAPYQHDPSNSRSYFVTTRTADGKDRTVWGVDLARAVKTSGVQPGDAIETENLGEQPVTIQVPVRNEAKQIVGYTSQEVNRVCWAVRKIVGPEADAARDPQVAAALAGQDVAQETRSGVVQNAAHSTSIATTAPPATRQSPILIEHGRAPYKNDAHKDPSYFVKVREADGRETTHWGVDLARAVKESGAQNGDAIDVKNLGKQPVTVRVKVRDAANRVIGEETKETQRVTWELRKVDAAMATAGAAPALSGAEAAIARPAAQTSGWGKRRTEAIAATEVPATAARGETLDLFGNEPPPELASLEEAKRKVAVARAAKAAAQAQTAPTPAKSPAPASEAPPKLKTIAEEKARIAARRAEREAADRVVREAEGKARQEAERAERQRRDEEAQRARVEKERAKREAKEQAKREAAEKAKRARQARVSGLKR
ncbi:exonuclease V subunit alpha [Burkholderia pseudomallei]|nr:exonuclease V subunit alpha [Burkholderia pseudomallei]VCK72837.1 exonuclease V subunit alpha [Burkholderia pseudomallei]VCK80006.1 exonuclease V subunit alpha [Burkholderia pseudomallei]VCK80009.1 exonuclease V subunit alpha [Burkholderia pseudomallei]VCK80776.1 exonuclease V subunit alpha [Burkholderia pseudomallei]